MPLLSNNLNNLRKLHLKGWIILIVLTFFLLMVAANLAGVVINASNNYQVLVSEQQSLEELRGQKQRLEQQLAYYKSYEYKKIYARDHLNMVKDGERLYEINTDPEFYQVRERSQQLVQRGDYAQWWSFLLVPSI